MAERWRYKWQEKVSATCCLFSCGAWKCGAKHAATRQASELSLPELPACVPA